jgi:hypothetical protein
VKKVSAMIFKGTLQIENGLTTDYMSGIPQCFSCTWWGVDNFTHHTPANFMCDDDKHD